MDRTMDRTMTAGEIIQSKRIKMGLTQLKLRDKMRDDFEMDTTNVYISNIENDKTGVPPSFGVLNCLAEVLDIDINLILDLYGKFNKKAVSLAIIECQEIGELVRAIESGRVNESNITEILKMINWTSA